MKSGQQGGEKEKREEKGGKRKGEERGYEGKGKKGVERPPCVSLHFT